MFAQLYIFKWYCNTFKSGTYKNIELGILLGISEIYKNSFLFVKDPDIIQFWQKLSQTLLMNIHGQDWK